ncbi:hypothetical protein FBZ96_11281 [Bradyrhizobium stylosanthis]|uniref:Uncharacterized protein n=1 Tax=Bradyrhizobium stylosanthis TaxID=1803665 RepID=A0A560D4M6_9BRAD|nr:hypothetical protein FBZ96_11281 [Bradyrhizobium stylosanthis]
MSAARLASLMRVTHHHHKLMGHKRDALGGIATAEDIHLLSFAALIEVKAELCGCRRIDLGYLVLTTRESFPDDLSMDDIGR